VFRKASCAALDRGRRGESQKSSPSDKRRRKLSARGGPRKKEILQLPRSTGKKLKRKRSPPEEGLPSIDGN